jgi:DNA-binding PadR family transcriptional regulator
MKISRFGKDLATGSYDLLVLNMLTGRPVYVYEIIREISERSRHTIRWHQGTTYRVLYDLERQGLVTSHWRGPKGGRQRRYYTITGHGRRVYQLQRSQWRAFSTAVNALLDL